MAFFREKNGDKVKHCLFIVDNFDRIPREDEKDKNSQGSWEGGFEPTYSKLKSKHKRVCV